LKGEASVAKIDKAAKTATVEVPPDRYQALRKRLENQRDEILNMYKQDLRAGQESADDGTEDIVDRANNAYNRELMFSLSDTERNTLLQIENALRRMDEGTYGRCANCGQSIAMARLEALPWARFCVDCQELAEKGILEMEAS
jgi:DnaK suppressor protein